MIEGHEYHTRTAAVRIDLERVLSACNYLNELGEGGAAAKLDLTRLAKATEVTGDAAQQGHVLELPVTQAVIYGWYDNELGSYTNMLGDRTVSIARMM